MDKLRERLSGYNPRSLSLSGCVTLAKSVLSTIPYSVMQTTCLPASVYGKIEELIRSFVSGEVRSDRKIHLVHRDDISKPLYAGGLGFRKPRLRNSTFLMKVAY